DRKRLLRGGAVVEVGERLAVLLAGQDRKLAADLLDGRRGGGNALRPGADRGGLHAREAAYAAASTSSRIQPQPRSSSVSTSSGPPSLTARPSNMTWTKSGFTRCRMRW